MDKTKILFVCMGNICRSPSAEAVMKKLVEDKGLSDQFFIDSAGTIGYHSGEPADSRMKRHADNRGVKLTSISRQVNPSVDFESFDIIVGMDDANMSDLYSVAPNENGRKKLVKMTDFCQSTCVNSVPDPYYGGSAGFEKVLDILEDACEGLLIHLNIGK